MKQNKTVAITGGTKGIGRAMVEKFAKNGFNIITCARNRRDLKELKTAIEAQFGIECQVFVANLAIKEQVLAFASLIQESEQNLAALIHNAGVYVPDLIAKTEDGLVEKLMETNLYSAFYLTNQLIEKIKKSESHVFTMCSVASLASYPNSASYTISKFALLGFSKALREEMKPFGVKVTAVIPGAVQTPSWGDIVLPENQIMPAEDIAEAVFMAFSLSKSTVIEELLIKPLS
jgi:short-subunit dehydrogenase